MSQDLQDINWDRLDKKKFITYGAGLFSGVTLCLFPLSVIKTRQMTQRGAPAGLSGAAKTAASIVRQEGITGLYRGFGTVMLGALPARMVYLNTLELSKANFLRVAHKLPLSESEAAGAANFVAGACASLVTQSIVVPIDVVSQRQMVAGAQLAGSSSGSGTATLGVSALGHRRSGLEIVRGIIRNEGVGGLYRGLGASLATFVPSSALWWGAYGLYQKLLWSQLDRGLASEGGQEQASRAALTTGDLVAVQTASALMAGCTSSVFTNPLDVIKTRLQVAVRTDGAAAPSFRGVLRELLAEEGMKGLFRGVLPRMANVALWGTCMVSTYEFLKRLCVLPEQ